MMARITQGGWKEKNTEFICDKQACLYRNSASLFWLYEEIHTRTHTHSSHHPFHAEPSSTIAPRTHTYSSPFYLASPARSLGLPFHRLALFVCQQSGLISDTTKQTKTLGVRRRDKNTHALTKQNQDFISFFSTGCRCTVDTDEGGTDAGAVAIGAAAVVAAEDDGAGADDACLPNPCLTQ